MSAMQPESHIISTADEQEMQPELSSSTVPEPEADRSSSAMNADMTSPAQAPEEAMQEPEASTSTSSAAPPVKKADANLKVWKPFTGMPPRIPELPDSYYNPTAGQLRAAQAGQSSRLKSLGVQTEFTTRKQREQEANEKELARVKRYPRTVVRIRFHDRHQIETVFPSSSTIKSVYNFAKSTLNEETKNEPFILYTAPRTDYKLTDSRIEGKSLLDLQLAPSSVILIRFSKDSLNDGNKPAPLRPDLLSIAEDLPQPPTFDPSAEQIASQNKETEGGENGDGKGKTAGGSGAKVPKWLQKVAKK